MSGCAGYIVIHDHNWFVHLNIFLVSSIGQLTSIKFLVCADIES